MGLRLEVRCGDGCCCDCVGGESEGVGQVNANVTRGGVPMGLRRGFC